MAVGTALFYLAIFDFIKQMQRKGKTRGPVAKSCRAGFTSQVAAHLMIRFGKIKMVANRTGFLQNCGKPRKLGIPDLPPQPFFFSQTLEYDETSRQLRCQARIATFCDGGPCFSLERLIERGTRKTSHWEQALTGCNWVAGNARVS